MQLRNTLQAYGLVARFLHWAMFLLIGLTVMLALNMKTMPETDKLLTEQVHRSLGLVIFILLALRFGWKLANPQPADLPGPAWLNRAAHRLHWLFYFIILLQIIAGIAMSQADGAVVSLFGLFDLPVMLRPDRQAKDFWKEIHETNWILLTVLIIGHVAAALWHHFSERRDVFARMGIGPP